MKITLSLLTALVLIGAHQLHSQEDSTGSNQPDEQLLEQASEDSPVLDIIGARAQAPQSQLAIAVRSRITQSLQKSEGFSKTSYLGSSLKSYQRMVMSVGRRFSGGFLMTKDAGEQRLNEFTTWNLTVSNLNFIKTAVVGDYRIEAGQGVALWRGYDFSKGGEVIAPALRSSRGLVSSVSTDEVEYFRGIAAELHSRKFSFLAFVSSRRLSASIDTSRLVTALNSSGYFRTPSEQARRDNLTEKLYGLHSTFFVDDQKEVGLTFYQTAFSSQLLLNGGKRFSGDRYSLLAFDYRLVHGSAATFGEWALSNSSVGGISGVYFTPIREIGLVASIRSYPEQFVSLHGLAFGERTSTFNESGLYLGVKLQLTASVSLSTYYDQFRFPGATSTSKFSTTGKDFLLKFELRPLQKLQAILRWQRKITDERSSLHAGALDRQRLQRIRVQLDYRISARVQLRSTAERVFVDWRDSFANEKGLLLYHEIAAQPGTHLRWNLRIAYFQSDSYNSRLYEFERDLDGVLTIPVLYGTGIRWYALIRYRFGGHLQVAVKYSELIRDDVKHIGSGLDELPSNRDERVGVQLDWGL